MKSERSSYTKIAFEKNEAMNPLVCCLVARSRRKRGNRQTDTTLNHRCACAPRVSKVPPDYLPAHIEYSSSFTAELLVNYYSINCLCGILPSHHLECWRHFVLAPRLLCKQTMNMDDVNLADTLLLKFCQRCLLHAHLLECVTDYGPMCNFRLFSFERFNVFLLGNKPTNNRSIELQLVNCFIRDNAHLQLLSSIPSNEVDAANVLPRVVLLNFRCNM